MNFAQSNIEQCTEPAGAITAGLSARGPGSMGKCFPAISLCCQGWSIFPAVPMAPNPHVVIPNGSKIRVCISFSHGWFAIFSATYPHMIQLAHKKAGDPHGER